ncbi:MAG: hypothetical protein QOG60_1263, partial [Frankiaceae bacterium]|nr:hypothetical protein [Frankiaceae bacterium]
MNGSEENDPSREQTPNNGSGVQESNPPTRLQASRPAGAPSATLRSRLGRKRTMGAGLTISSVAALLVAGTAALTPASAAGTAMAAGMDPNMNMGAATTTSCPAPVSSPALSKFTQQLPVPPKVDLRSGGTAALTMRGGKHQFHADLPATPSFGYTPAGSSGTDAFGGPTIEAQKGKPASIAVTNTLGAHPLAPYMDHTFMGMTSTDETAPRGVVHLHGAHSEPSQDGLPADTFTPGNTKSYKYVNDQDATGLWYHDHSWGMTRLQVAAGLAGQYWLRDGYDTGAATNPLGLPSGSNELPLTIQDKSFNPDGSFAYPVGAFCGQPEPAGYPNQWSPESFGDVATVNGKATPNLNVARGVYRFRVLNASNARFYHVKMPTGAAVYQIGTDGGLLNAPVQLSDLLLAPAERADILVDFRNSKPGSTFQLTNDAGAPYGDSTPADPLDGTMLPDLMQFTVTGATGFQGNIPSTLRGGKNQPAPLPTLKPTSTRTVSLNEITDPTLGEPVHGHINNQFYADSTGMHPRTTQIENPKLNSVEEWDIVNTTGDAHPIHIHLTQFRLLNRQAFDEPAYTAAVNAGLPAPGLPDPSVSGQGPWPAKAASAFLQGAPMPPA